MMDMILQTQPITQPLQGDSPAPLAAQPVAPLPQSGATYIAPASFSPHPEQAAIPLVAESAPVLLETSHPEPELTPEVVEAGVSVVAERPELSPEARLAGIELAKEAVPVQTESTGLVSLPMSAEKATEILKTDHNPTDARVWAANVILYELHKKQLQEELKKEGESVTV